MLVFQNDENYPLGKIGTLFPIITHFPEEESGGILENTDLVGTVSDSFVPSREHSTLRILDVHVVPDNNLINDTKNLGFHILSVQAYNRR